MAKPKVFISSTHFDLKHIRSSMESFINSLGYESVLSEKGDIAYQHDKPLDEACYKEVENCDIFVLIIGGRYGSPVSDSHVVKKGDFYQKFESVTEKEFESAIAKDIPVYILIERHVLAEYETFKKNRDNKDIVYAHADSVNIFHFIYKIFNLKRNNPVKEFDNHNEIEEWLKVQWAGLLRELIHSKNHNNELKGLKTQIESLSEINNTLKTYLEALISNVPDDKGVELIKKETERLHTKENYKKLLKINYIDSIVSACDFDIEKFVQLISNSKNFKSFAEKICLIALPEKEKGFLYRFWLADNPTVLLDFIKACEILKLDKLKAEIEQHMPF